VEGLERGQMREWSKLEERINKNRGGEMRAEGARLGYRSGEASALRFFIFFLK
jgi:hypothetical protein